MKLTHQLSNSRNFVEQNRTKNFREIPQRISFVLISLPANDFVELEFPQNYPFLGIAITLFYHFWLLMPPSYPIMLVLPLLSLVFLAFITFLLISLVRTCRDFRVCVLVKTVWCPRTARLSAPHFNFATFPFSNFPHRYTLMTFPRHNPRYRVYRC